MTDDELATPGILRAATALVDAASAPDSNQDLLDGAVTALAQKFRGKVMFAKPRVDGVPDPELYLLSTAHGGSPLGLDSDLLSRFADGSAGEVTMTGLQVVLVADLLRELAARLRPGAAFGVGTNGLALGERTRKLADTLTESTPVRRPLAREFDPVERAEWLTHAMSVYRPDLRNAVIRVLDVVGIAHAGQPANPPPLSDVLGSGAGQAAMAALARATHGGPAPAVVGPDDPGLFLRSVDGRPIFDEANALRELLAAEAVSSPEPPLVTIGAETAIVTGLLLRELASRLLPGISYGLLGVRSDLGILADDLAAELLAQTRYGRPFFYPGPTRMWITASDRLQSDGTAPDVIDPVDHLMPAELLIPTVDSSKGETFGEYERIRAAALDLSRLLDDKTARDDHFAQVARQLHSAIMGTPEDSIAEPKNQPAEVVHQQWRAVELSHAEVVIAADLLDELATRIGPGAAFGPSGDLAESSGEYTEMAARLRDLSSTRRSAIAATTSNSRTKLGRLRDAAIHWLDIVADGRDGWRVPSDPVWRDATINLYLLAQDRPARTPTPPVRDPARHLRRQSGNATAGPVELTAEAADIARLLRGADTDPDPILVPDNLAPYVGKALGELATRLKGAGAPRQSDDVEPLAAITAQLGRRILARALVGYYRSWDRESEQPGPRGHLSEAEARERDRAGAPYSVVFGEAHSPDTIIDMYRAAEELRVTKVDEQGRPRLSFEFERKSPTKLFLAQLTLYRYDGDGLGGVRAEQYSFEPGGTATRVTVEAGRSTREESVAEITRMERLWLTAPQFGDWEPLRDLNPLTWPRAADRPQVHYSLAWDPVRATPRAVISAGQARRRDAEGLQYCVILGPQDDPRVLITVCRNDNAFAVHFFDDAKRFRAIHTFRWVEDRFLHQAQQRLIYAGPSPRETPEYTLLATFEVRLDGLARAVVVEPHGRGVVSERIDSVDVTQYWCALPEFGAWEWAGELDPSPEHWAAQDLVP